MQVLCTVGSIATYIAACNPFDVVPRPDVCQACAQRGGFHRHGTYERYVNRDQITVARFRCKHGVQGGGQLPAFVGEMVSMTVGYLANETVIARIAVI